MARKPRKSPARRSAAAGAKAAPTNGGGASRPASTRERIIQAFMRLLAEKPIEDVGFAEIATRAGVSLSELREAFGAKLAILAAHVKEIDRRVLAAEDAEMAEESPRERLFDVLMRRIELLEPHKPAVRSLVRSCERNPPLALALNGVAVRSQQWMLAAANIDGTGTQGMVRAQGLALLFASVLRVWIHDEDPGHARTMAALDRALARGQRWSGLLDVLCRIPRFVSRTGRRRRWDADDVDDERAAA